MNSQEQYSTPPRDLRFHKSIDLIGKNLNVITEPCMLNSTGANSLAKVPSLSSLGSGLRKGSFLSSPVNTSRFKSTERTSNNNYVPQVSISELIRKKAHLYHDEALSVNLDGVLESGYSLVLTKKHQKTLLKDNEERMREEINALEKEILPEMNKLFANKERVKYHKATRAKYQVELEESEKQNVQLSQGIAEKKQELEGLETSYIKKIKDLENLTAGYKHDYATNKITHKQEIYDFNQLIKKNQQGHEKQLEELNKIKSEYEKLNRAKVDRKRKMENKAKMFLGILKH